MLNLLRFHADGGRERYSSYLAAARHLVARYGAEIVYVGDGPPALSAENGQAWDVMALLRYPSRQAFASMVRDPKYREKAAPLRSALAYVAGLIVETILRFVVRLALKSRA